LAATAKTNIVTALCWSGSSDRPLPQGSDHREQSPLVAPRKTELSQSHIVGLAILASSRRRTMHGLIYLIGLIVVIMAILSFFGLR
jgi:hypothetical protein